MIATAFPTEATAMQSVAEMKPVKFVRGCAPLKLASMDFPKSKVDQFTGVVS